MAKKFTIVNYHDFHPEEEPPNIAIFIVRDPATGRTGELHVEDLCPYLGAEHLWRGNSHGKEVILDTNTGSISL